jgi:adenosylhomocysteine nucleosidase
MLLRWLVNQYLRDAAEEKVREVLSDTLGGRGPRTKLATKTKTDASQSSEPAELATEGDEFLPCEAAFLFALNIEAGGFTDQLKDTETTRHKHGVEHAGTLGKRQVVVVESGVGSKAAARATRAAIDFYQPRWIISAGFAGALDDNLRRGHILMANEVASLAGERLAVGLSLDPATAASTRGLHVGRLLTVDDIIRKPADRRSLQSQHGASACDMESFAVARVCRDLGTRFLSVRIISDALEDELPPELEHLLKQKTIAGKIGAAAGAMLHRFGAAKDMWKLREDALKASDRLAKFLCGVVQQLD